MGGLRRRAPLQVLPELLRALLPGQRRSAIALSSASRLCTASDDNTYNTLTRTEREPLSNWLRYLTPEAKDDPNIEGPPPPPLLPSPPILTPRSP
jgi:hypothetical protein